MKRLTLLLFTLFICAVSYAQEERYVDDIFAEVDVTADVAYAQNWTVLTVPVTGAPTKETLRFDFFSGSGDTDSNRPLVIVLHSGNFLPPIVNGSVDGSRKDPYIVDFCNKLAKKGYAVAAVSYRLGWNPISDNQDERTSTLINAAYRGVQDLNTAVRFFKKSVDDGNPYGIDPEKIVAFGVGTGGYVSTSAAGIDAYEDMLLDKFFTTDPNGNPIPMVIEQISGDYEGKSVGINPLTGDTLATPNYVEYSSDFQMSVNVGGAIGDVSWINEGDPAFMGFHVPTDPNAPYKRGDVIVPTTGDFVVEAYGSYSIVEKANQVGLNDKFASADYIFDDAYTESANAKNDGNEGLFPMVRPRYDLDGDGIIDVDEGSPWRYWDAAFWSTQAPDECGDDPIEQCNWHLISLLGDPGMTLERAQLYQDSVIAYFAPRACVQLDLPCAVNYTSVDDVDLDKSYMTIAPNPAAERVTISSEKADIRRIEIYSVEGRLTDVLNNINSRSYDYYNSLPNGVYFIKSYFDEGVVTERVIFNK